MEKILTTILILALLTQPVIAKNITVIFNFPEGTTEDIEQLMDLAEDANAFHAFTRLADQEGLALDMTYYSSFDAWFINGINGVMGNQDQYWHYWVNNESSMEGISSSIPQDQDIIELGYADQPKGKQKTATENALRWLVSNQKQDGEIGEHKVWGNAFALIAINLFEGNETTKQEAANYLLDNQQEDAGFPYPGLDSDALHTSATTMALIANDLNLGDMEKNNSTPIEFLLTKQENDGGFSGWGQSDVDTTSWSVLALVAANQEMPTKNDNSPLDYLSSAQNPDGGFGYQEGQNSTTDYTAEALIALAALEQENQITANAINWLKQQQDNQGCFSNAYTTSLGIMSLKAFDEGISEAKTCLEEMQLADNGFGRDGENSNAIDTALAIIALEEAELPTKKLEAQENPDLVGVSSIVKFTVKITNSGLVPAKNVNIVLEGIPEEWIQEQTSETSYSEIAPGQTIYADIYAEIREAGEMSVFATVTGQGMLDDKTSNMLSFEAGAADLDVTLSMQG